MKYSTRLFQFIFWGLVCLSLWVGLKQCDQGRLTEAFAETDTGLRNNLARVDKILQEDFLELESFVKWEWHTEGNEAYITRFSGLLDKYRPYQQFLDSIRTQLLLASSLPTNQPLTAPMSKNYDRLAKRVLASQWSPVFQEITTRTESLRLAILEAGDQDEAIYQAMPLNETVLKYGKYVFEGDLYNLPLSGVLALLSNLQVSAQGSMVCVLNYCNSRISDRIICNRYSPFTSVYMPFVLNGEHYQADVFLDGYSNSIMNYKIEVNGREFPMKNGTARITLPANTPGLHQYRVTISGNLIGHSFKKYYHDTFQLTKNFAYRVTAALPCITRPASVSYLFAYTGNPVTVTAWDGERADPVRLSDSDASIKNLNKNSYDIIPHTLKPVTLAVGPFSTFTFAVRSLPDPIVEIGGYSASSYIKRDVLAQIRALHARFPEDFDFQVDSKVLGFHLTRFRQREDPEEVENQGSTFNEAVRHLLKTAQPGDRLVFDEVRVQCGEEPAPRTIGVLSLRVQ